MRTLVGCRGAGCLRQSARAAVLGAVFAGLAVGAPAALASSDGECGSSGVYAQSGLTASCTYSSATDSGLADTFAVPTGVTSATVTAVGGEGSAGQAQFDEGAPGGYGAVVTATVSLNGGADLVIQVAGNGAVVAGGAGGGGNGSDDAGGGGGASSVTANTTPLVVAGGGGGGASYYGAGSGGDADQAGQAASGPFNCNAAGGQSGDAGGGGGLGSSGSYDNRSCDGQQGGDGAPGQGGDGGANAGGGGGGGYVGGGGGGGTTGFGSAGGAGGGSSYAVDPDATITTDTTGVPEVVISWDLATTSVSSSLSDGGQSGTSVSVGPSTPVTDAATLSGPDASAATGTVTYSVYSDAACTDVVDAGTAEEITTPGTLPASAGVSLDTPGNYYWQVSYSGDGANAPAVSACGSEIETVMAPTATQLSTALTGGSESGTSVAVVQGVPVVDQASLSGVNAGSASGTVTYQVYSDPLCQTPLFTPMVETVTGGVAGASLPVYLPTGTYYWTASYSGDPLDDPSSEPCGAETSVVLGGAKYGADIAVTLEAPSGASIQPGVPFGVDLTVTDYGPKPASSIISGISIPAGLTVLNADGAKTLGGLLLWRTGSFTAGQTFTYQLIAQTSASTGTDTIKAGALSLATLDSNYKNNFASETITLGGVLSADRVVRSDRSSERALLLDRLRALGRITARRR